MGMAPRMGTLWGEANAKYLASQQRTSRCRPAGSARSRKVLRLTLQSGVLGLGAYLVIQQQATAGIIIASSILVARALAPVELAIANWRGFVAARQSWRRLSDLLGKLRTERGADGAAGAASATLAVEGVAATPPGTQRVVVQDVSFGLKAGQGLGIIGPSASGKSSLARLLVGVWSPVRGKVRLDGAALDQWSPAAARPRTSATCRRTSSCSPARSRRTSRASSPMRRRSAIIAAAKAAGVHDMIVRLPEGYETQIGESGAVLSAGQRQRIALARALYRDPFLVVLDEPNSNLDAEGDKALTQAIMSVRARGGIVIVVAHRPSALAGVDQVLAMVQRPRARLRPARRGPGEAVQAAQQPGAPRSSLPRRLVRGGRRPARSGCGS